MTFVDFLNRSRRNGRCDQTISHICDDLDDADEHTDVDVGHFERAGTRPD